VGAGEDGGMRGAQILEQFARTDETLTTGTKGQSLLLEPRRSALVECE
jgi:hypothetical protein